ncbi:ABC transporter permease [Treponema sp.]|uniref:ABC transporter permease n=1 Tax=Treponema sp. TaxID=166 RepID=UPI0025FE1868|nr:ABC transporter permease [Treponema sp.]MCR5219319.1 ABC transporter permease [Treponema sp.]
MALIIQYTLIFASVLVLVALGGMFSERSGIINIGLEGIMVFGALGGAFVLSQIPPGTNAFVIVLLTILVSAICGMISSLLLAVAAINFKADQTLVGTAINMLATAAATVIVTSFNTARTAKAAQQDFSDILKYNETRESLLINIGSLKLNWFIVIAILVLIAATIILYRTRFGLRLWSCGEHPQAADSVGINVYKMRYAGVIISGILGGIGGITYISSASAEWKFSNGVTGAGFLALAVMIFGQWKPLYIAGSALLFGFFYALSFTYSAFDFLLKALDVLHLPSESFQMLPYIISLIVLALTSKKSRAPKAEGIPYDKGSR